MPTPRPVHHETKLSVELKRRALGLQHELQRRSCAGAYRRAQAERVEDILVYCGIDSNSLRARQFESEILQHLDRRVALTLDPDAAADDFETAFPVESTSKAKPSKPPPSNLGSSKAAESINLAGSS